MATGYTLKRLTDVDDSAPHLGAGDWQTARFAGADLGLEHLGMAHHSMPGWWID